VFVVGFGVLELNLIYPAIALCWAILRIREGARPVRVLALSTVPLFALSAGYYVLHRAVAPPQAAGAYAMHFDGAIPQTLWTYCQWAMVSPEWVPVTQLDPRLGLALAGALGIALLSFTAYQAWRRRFLPAFFLAWVFSLPSPRWSPCATISRILSLHPVHRAGGDRRESRWPPLFASAIWWKAAAGDVVRGLPGRPDTRSLAPMRSGTTSDRSRCAILSWVSESAHRLHPTKTILLTGGVFRTVRYGDRAKALSVDPRRGGLSGSAG